MNEFRVGDHVRIVKDCVNYTYTKVGSEGFVTDFDGVLVKVEFYKFIGPTPSYEKKYWIRPEDLELINDEIKLGDKVYFLSSIAMKKVYGIVRHIGKLPSTDPSVREVGEDGCIWSEWDREWNGKISSASLGWMAKERVYRVCGEKISRYQELKQRIENIMGWTKQADNILNELVNRFSCFVGIKVYHDGGKDEKHKGAISVELGNRALADPKFDFGSQCQKLEAFKQALLWLLDHSDIKKDEREERIKEVEKQRDELATQVRSLNLKIEELRS